MKTRKVIRRKRNQNRTIQIIIVIGVVIFVSGLLMATQMSNENGLQKAITGKAIGDFSLTDLDGETISLSSYQGKYVLINAWATWCPPCRAEMPDLNAFYQQHHDEGFEILAINAGDSWEEASQFAESYGLEFTVLLDQDGTVINGLGISGFPTSILVDPSGKVAMIHIGMMLPEDLRNKVLPYLQ